MAADAAFYFSKNEAAAKAKGVKRICIPNRSIKSPDRKREQRKRGFRDGQRWRAPVAKDASAWSSGDMASPDAVTKASSE